MVWVLAVAAFAAGEEVRTDPRTMAKNARMATDRRAAARGWVEMGCSEVGDVHGGRESLGRQQSRNLGILCSVLSDRTSWAGIRDAIGERSAATSEM
jgi:hypothetical protein